MTDYLSKVGFDGVCKKELNDLWDLLSRDTFYLNPVAAGVS